MIGIRKVSHKIKTRGFFWTILYVIFRFLKHKRIRRCLILLEKQDFLREAKGRIYENKTLKPLAMEEFNRLLDDYPVFLGEYYKSRWPYLKQAIEIAVEERPENILEVGSSWLPLFKGADVMDIRADVPNLKYHHDLSKIRWPIPDFSYDLLIGLQVWEHLGDKQADAFREVMRVAKKAILSFPYKWDCPHDLMHHMIDEEKIARWTLNVKPVKVIQAQGRIIYFFKF